MHPARLNPSRIHFRSCFRSRALALCLATGAGAGCGEEEPGVDEEAGEDDEPLPGPPIIEVPELAELTLPTTTVEDLEIVAGDLQPDTQVVVDGLEVPGLALPSPEGFVLPLGGAVLGGAHELVLSHRSGSKIVSSEPLALTFEATPAAPLSVSVVPSMVASGDLVTLEGQREQTVLALVDHADESARLWIGGDWTGPGAQVELPGIDGRPAFALVEVDDEPALVAAWLADADTRVLARWVSVDEDGVLGDAAEPELMWDLASEELDELLGPHELARLGAVKLLDRMVVIALEARRDAESSTPGDHLLGLRWLLPGGAPADAQILRGPGSRDLDGLGPALMFVHDPPLSLALRVDGAFPWLLQLGGNGQASLSESPGEDTGLFGEPSYLATIDGAFGSRHAFSLDGEQLKVLWIDRWRDQARQQVVNLPFAPSGDPAVSVIAGSPTVLVPTGPDTSVTVLASTGASLQLSILSTLSCEQIVVPAGGPEGGDLSSKVPFACLVEGQLWVGALTSS